MRNSKTTMAFVTACETVCALAIAVLGAGCSKDEKPGEGTTATGTASAAPSPAAPPVVVAPTATPPTAAAPAPAAAKTPHKACPTGQMLAKVADAEDCLKSCKTQADCPNKTFCTSGVLVDPPGEHAKLCFKVD